jgi:hypothetical protein
MTQTHLITPPPELVKKIFGDALRGSDGQHDYELRLIHAAYAAGAEKEQALADQELEACCECIRRIGLGLKTPGIAIAELRAARRPKPPSLKEQALAVLDDWASCLDGAHKNTIRRALEALDD